MKTTKSGIRDSVDMANNAPQALCPVGSINILNATDIVNLDGFIKYNICAKKSFHTAMNVKIATVINPGNDNGSMK